MSITKDMPMAEYISLRGLSGSVAHRVITQSPFHARYSQTAPSDDSAVADIGTVAHKLILEGNNDGIQIIDADDWRTKAAKEQRDQAYAEGKTPILARKMDAVYDMVKSATDFIAQSEIAGCFNSGAPEQTVTWDDGGLACKARPDWLSDELHISLKTTDGSANPASWIRRQLTPMGYDFSISFYERGLLANGVDVQHRILVVEQNAPYGCCVVALAPSKKEIADRQVERAIALWKQCKDTGVYPGYSTQTHFAEAAAWEFTEAEEREANDFALGEQA